MRSRDCLYILIIVITGCRMKTGEGQYRDYISDPKNRITQQLTVGDVQTTVKWLPPEYRDRTTDSAGQERAETKMEGLYYFDLRFDRTGSTALDREKLLYLEFDIQKDFALISGADTMLPVICQRIAAGIANRFQYLLVFEEPAQRKAKNNFTLLYIDKIFGTGLQAFVYEEEDIQKIPTPKTAK